MNVLDSRFLRLGDCYAQKFSKPGTVHYAVTIGAGAGLPLDNDSYTIEVKRPAKGPDAKNKPITQYNVVVTLQNGALTAEPAHLEIETGDVVLWHTTDAATPGFAVVGEQGKETFSSSALRDDAIYTHAFGVPGHYEWVDANGDKVCGEIIVKNFEATKPEHHKKWLTTLSKGTQIKIDGAKASPRKVEIVIGQTVFWFVEKARGISITDARLVRKHPASA
jgi:plastocyanin